MIFLIVPLIAAVLLFPYGWAVFYRHRMLKRLIKIGKPLGFVCKPLRRGYLFSLNRSSRFDFILAGKDRIYLVKLWSCYRRGTSLLVNENGMVSVRSCYRLPIQREEGQGDVRERVDGKWRPVPKTEFPRIKQEGKQVIPVLLNYPTYDAAYRKKDGRLLPIKNADILFSKKFYTPSALERAMKEKLEP